MLRAPAALCGIRIRELSGSGGKPQERYYGYGRRPAGRPQWQDSRDTEFVSTGDLELTAEGPAMSYGGYKIRDSATMTHEDRLPRVFRRIDMHRLEQEWREQERERAAAERRRRWEAAMVDARARYEEQARWDAFLAPGDAWALVAPVLTSSSRDDEGSAGEALQRAGAQALIAARTPRGAAHQRHAVAVR